eukprot:3183292-Rhodomonas_salina.1
MDPKSRSAVAAGNMVLSGFFAHISYITNIVRYAEVCVRTPHAPAAPKSNQIFHNRYAQRWFLTLQFGVWAFGF